MPAPASKVISGMRAFTSVYAAPHTTLLLCEYRRSKRPSQSHAASATANTASMAERCAIARGLKFRSNASPRHEYSTATSSVPMKPRPSAQLTMEWRNGSVSR